MNGLINFDKTDRVHSIASIDDLARFWRSKVKDTAGLSMWSRMHPRRRWASELSCGVTELLDAAISRYSLKAVPLWLGCLKHIS